LIKNNFFHTNRRKYFQAIGPLISEVLNTEQACYLKKKMMMIELHDIALLLRQVSFNVREGFPNGSPAIHQCFVEQQIRGMGKEQSITSNDFKTSADYSVKTALLVVVSALASCSGGTGFKSVP
jgi:hypothetical protein